MHIFCFYYLFELHCKLFPIGSVSYEVFDILSATWERGPLVRSVSILDSNLSAIFFCFFLLLSLFDAAYKHSRAAENHSFERMGWRGEEVGSQAVQLTTSA